MQPLPPGIGPGRGLVVRGRSWTLTAAESYEDCAALRLDTTDGPVSSAVLLWPFDRPVAVARPPQWRAVRPRAWLQWAAVHDASDHGHPHLPACDGAAEVLPYQLAPALAIAGGEQFVMLADEVGLGKTAEAGWIVASQFAAGSDRRVMIAVPAGLREQWARELRALFAIDSSIVHARWMARTIGDRPAGVSPWAAPGVYIVSLDYLKQADIAAAAARVVWDLLIVDEAHTAAAPTDRHAALQSIARVSRCTVLVTATPFSGSAGSFISLTALGGRAEGPLMFRRSRSDVGEPQRRRHRFVRVRIAAAEARLQRLLERYTQDLWREAPGPEGRLLATVLRKRALSSPAAVLRSLERRARLLQSGDTGAVQLSLFDDDHIAGDEEPAALGAPGLADGAREQRQLDALLEAARRAAPIDSKRRFLARLVRRMRGESILIFTEFRDTLADLVPDHPEAMRLHGGLGPAERAAVQERFNRDGGLLFATDTAAEGLNLHGQCRCVVNFELPWNPARLEQRLGRVDRIGQKRVVHASTLVARDTAEDLVIANLVRRLFSVANALGAHDRLAAFLDDARTAGIVLGSESAAAPDAPWPPVRRADTRSPAADAEAARLQRLRGFPSRLGSSRDVFVSSVRAGSQMPPGIVLVLQWTLTSVSGIGIARRSFAVHVPQRMARPVHAADLRREARHAASRYLPQAIEMASALIGSAGVDTERAYQRSTVTAIDREREIGTRPDAWHLLQPGLFDRRAVDEAQTARDTERAVAMDVAARIRTLEANRALSPRWELAGVLLVWDPAS